MKKEIQLILTDAIVTDLIDADYSCFKEVACEMKKNDNRCYHQCAKCLANSIEEYLKSFSESYTQTFN